MQQQMIIALVSKLDGYVDSNLGQRFGFENLMHFSDYVTLIKTGISN